LRDDGIHPALTQRPRNGRDNPRISMRSSH